MNCKKCGYELESDTKFCPNCGHDTKKEVCQHCKQELDDDIKFCPNCGKPVATKTDQVVCATCGQILQEDTVFCFNCGNKVIKEDTDSNQEISIEQPVEDKEEIVKENLDTKETIDKESTVHQMDTEIPTPIQPIQNVKEDSKKSFWKNPILWIVSISLLVICLLISLYFQSLPTKKKSSNSSNITEKENKEVKDVSKLKIKGTNSIFVNQTNVNIGGYTYVFDNKLYVSANNKIYRYDLDYSNEEQVVDDSGTYLYVNQDTIYYCDYVNDFIQYNMTTQESEVLLEDVYYAQVIERNVYYQNDQDNESIYVYNLDSKENKKLNDVPSYTIVVDASNNSIYYIDEYAALCKMNLDGSEVEEITQDVTEYLLYEGSLYCVNEKGIEKYDIATGKISLVLKKSSIKDINILKNRIVFSVYYDGIYSVDLNGENRKMLVDQRVSSFEVQGDKIIFDCNNDYAYQVVDDKGNYGKLPTEKSDLRDNEDDDIDGAHSF